MELFVEQIKGFNHYIYNYKCHECGYEFQGIDDLTKSVGTVTDCPQCGEIAGAWNERTDVNITISCGSFDDLTGIYSEYKPLKNFKNLDDVIGELISFWFRNDL